MEGRTKFNLEKSVLDWKSTVSKTPNLTNDNIAELESHLLDEIQHLQEIGLNKEEAFFVAQKRIGSIDVLKSEFGKVNKKIAYQNKILPYLNGILLYYAFSSLLSLITNLSILAAHKIGISDDYINHITIGLFILVSIAIIFFFFKKYRNERFQIGSLKNIPLLVGIILVTESLYILVRANLPHWIDISSIGRLSMNLYFFHLIFGLAVMTLTCILYHVSKRKKSMSLIG